MTCVRQRKHQPNCELFESPQLPLPLIQIAARSEIGITGTQSAPNRHQIDTRSTLESSGGTERMAHVTSISYDRTSWRPLSTLVPTFCIHSRRGRRWRIERKPALFPATWDIVRRDAHHALGNGSATSLLVTRKARES